MYVNMNGILAAQRRGAQPATRPAASVPQLGRAVACALVWPGVSPSVSPSRFLARVSRSLWTPLRLPVRVGGPCGSWRAWRRWCAVVGPGSGGWIPDGVLGRRFILRSLGMIRSIVTGFRRVYEDC